VSFTRPPGDPVAVTLGSELNYEVEFDVEGANAQGAWIQILFDGKNMGMVAGTTLESPYTSNVPSQPLSVGQHTLTCRLQPVGSATTYPIGEAVLNIEVK